LILISVGASPGALSVPDLVHEISSAGHQAEVVLEPGATAFIGPAAFSGTVVDEPAGCPQALVFVSATSGTIARLARGLDGGAVAELYNAGARPAIVAPDLDSVTANHPAVRENLTLISGDGAEVVEGGSAAVGEVSARVLQSLGERLKGVKVLVTAGGTREPVDSVRFVGNRSSGKMGLAIAREALRMGAEVSVVAANVERTEPGVSWASVETVEEMREAVLDLAGTAEVLVMAAAVSDFTPAERSETKIRRREGLSLDLIATRDILRDVREENPDLYVVGFAATHGDPRADAREKLEKKGADVIVGNDISRTGIGFGSEENEVYVVGRGEIGERSFPRARKEEIARSVLDLVADEIRGERR
jgi:phosphopantothenoylcysteine decarboxylase/phosphopantothenate--cysteine ligase